jgi:hypothetical protein
VFLEAAMPQILVPKAHVGDVEHPLVFLAGPIKGAPCWHHDAILHLLSYGRDITIATPGRIESVPTSCVEHVAYSKQVFPRQRTWELQYFERAMRDGVVLLWLPGELNHKCEKSYGAMTRMELGEVLVHHYYTRHTRFCIGSDGKFSELSTITYDLEHFAPATSLQMTLEATCREAIRIAAR